MNTSIMAQLRSHNRLISLVIAGAVLCSGAVAIAGIVSGTSTTNISARVAVTKLSINKPSVSTGDVMIASIAVLDGNIVNITAPSGWTLIARTDNDINVSLASYWKVASASEPNSYTWQFDEQTKAVGGITPYSGVNASNPIDAAAGNVGYGTFATTSVIIASNTNEEVIALFATDVSKNFSTPVGMNEKYDLSHSASGPQTASDDTVQAASGTVSSKTSTISGAKARNWTSQQIALRRNAGTPSILDTLPVTYQASPFNVNDMSFGYTVPSGGSNKVLIVQFCLGGGRVPTATQNGVNIPLTKISDTSRQCYHWYGVLANPTSGNFSLSWTGETGGTQVTVMTLANVDQSNPIDASNVSVVDPGASALSTSVTTTHGNDLLLDEAVGIVLTTPTYGSGQTQTHPSTGTEQNGPGTGTYKAAAVTAGSETMTRNFTPSDGGDLSVIAVKGI